MTPRQALNTVLNGHGATCDSVRGLACPRCIKEHEAVQVLRSLVLEDEERQLPVKGDGK